MDISEGEFLQHFLQNSAHMMWFLGAGTSRTAGLPTAADIIWDLKLRYYCLQENQELKSHDINNNAIKRKVQSYLDSKGFPRLWSSEEYSFYFELTFGDDYSAQQKYINEVLSSKKVSLNIGHRALAALLEMEKARVIFTTNFDDVIETAYANISGKNLSPFHLEGSYAALDALNAERFPIYAKIHGDFRYKSIKNLEADLISNDSEIQKCFLAAGVRYGLIVSGYSGRDANVMAMFREVLNNNNAFPHGLFWTVPRFSEVTSVVRELIDFARKKGIRAHLVETGTFDEMLSKIWRQISDKTEFLEAKVKSSSAKIVSIPLPAPGKKFPILRTNALPLIVPPKNCGSIDISGSFTFSDLKEKIIEKSPQAIITYTDKVLFWGNVQEVQSLFPKEKVNTTLPFEFENVPQIVSESTFIKSFFEEGLARALCRDKPLLLRRKNRVYFIVVRYDMSDDKMFLPLRQTLSFKDKPGYISGNVTGLQNVRWAEAVSVRLEERDGKLWVMLKPDIWVNPLSRRREAENFLRKRRLYRYNNKSYELLDAWISILFGEVGGGNIVTVSCFPDEYYKAVFEVGTRTAYSRGDCQ